MTVEKNRSKYKTYICINDDVGGYYWLNPTFDRPRRLELIICRNNSARRWMVRPESWPETMGYDEYIFRTSDTDAVVGETQNRLPTMGALILIYDKWYHHKHYKLLHMNFTYVRIIFDESVICKRCVSSVASFNTVWLLQNILPRTISTLVITKIEFPTDIIVPEESSRINVSNL